MPADDILTLIAAGAWALFVLAYALFARWYRTDLGRNTMLTSVGIALVLGENAYRDLVPNYEGHHPVRVVLYSTLILLAVQKTILFVRIQTSHHAPTATAATAAPTDTEETNQ